VVKIPKSILERPETAVANKKRPRVVVRHLLEFGTITTVEPKQRYGYEHPPRAIRDVKELGIPIESTRVKDGNGKTISVYRFGDLTKWKDSEPCRVAGRTALAKALKNALIERFGARCAIYLENLDLTLLQIDHRVPFEIGGESDVGRVENFMLLCHSANWAKSWACEHCENWTRKDVAFCLRCFWAHPEDYDHIAGQTMRQISILFSGDEIQDYRKLMRVAGNETAQMTIKRILHFHLNKVQ